MIKPRLALTVLKQGTHLVPLSEWNLDRPNPAECVAEALGDLEYRIAELVKVGGNPSPKPQEFNEFNAVQKSVEMLNFALLHAANQEWKLKLETI
jgi:hypothetical protein